MFGIKHLLDLLHQFKAWAVLLGDVLPTPQADPVLTRGCAADRQDKRHNVIFCPLGGCPAFGIGRVLPQQGVDNTEPGMIKGMQDDPVALGKRIAPLSRLGQT